MINKNNFFGLMSLFLIIFLIGQFFVYIGYVASMEKMHSEMHNEISHEHGVDIDQMNMDDKREEFIQAKDSIIGELIAVGDYACCLENPCTYCIEKSPKHGEGAKCTCLEDVMNGVHPCGECIGEIMEGHGNKFLAPYFSEAIAEEMGVEHKQEIMKMMTEKYGVPIEDQI